MSLTLGAMATYGGIMAAASLVGTAINNYFNEKNNKRQIKLSNTAVSRQIKDLENAGLSPTLFSGSGAATPNTVASQSGIDSSVQAFMSAQSMLKQQQDIATSSATQKYYESLSRGQDLKNVGYGLDNLFKTNQNSLFGYEKDMKAAQLDNLNFQVEMQGLEKKRMEAQLDNIKAQTKNINTNRQHTQQEINYRANTGYNFGSYSKTQSGNPLSHLFAAIQDMSNSTNMQWNSEDWSYGRNYAE